MLDDGALVDAQTVCYLSVLFFLFFSGDKVRAPWTKMELIAASMTNIQVKSLTTSASILSNSKVDEVVNQN